MHLDSGPRGVRRPAGPERPAPRGTHPGARFLEQRSTPGLQGGSQEFGAFEDGEAAWLLWRDFPFLCPVLGISCTTFIGIGHRC